MKRHTKNPRLEGIEFVLAELLRYGSMAFKERIEAAGDPPLAGIMNAPRGCGVMVCGIDAKRRIREMAAAALASSQWQGRIEPNAVTQELERMIADWFVKQGRELNEAVADRVVSRAIKRAVAKCTDIIHFVPCHVVDDEDPECFRIGPIIFRRSQTFLASMEPKFQSHISSELAESDPEERKFAEHLVDGVKTHFGQFNWVAEVSVDGCAPDVSRKRAEQCTECALNLLRVILGAQYSNRFRLDAQPFRPSRSAQLSQSPSGNLGFEITRSAGSGNFLGQGWWESVNDGGGKMLVVAGGMVVDVLRETPGQLPPLAERIIDALAWFGQAVSDPAPGTRILRYVAALERLTLFGDRDQIADPSLGSSDEEAEKITKTVTERAAKLCALIGGADLDQWRIRASEVYNARSRVAHGSWSPFDERLWRMAHEAESVAGGAIIQWLMISVGAAIRDTNMSNRQLAKGLDVLMADKLGRQPPEA